MYFRNGNIYTVGSEANDPTDKLPSKNLLIKNHPQMGFYFEECPSFELPKRIYGDHMSVAERILNTYSDRSSNTGVLLEGEKGSGKTLLGKLLSNLAAKKNIPTLIVNEPFSGPSFNQFIQSVQQEAIVFFDEFEKMYTGGSNLERSSGQEGLLTLLDGVFPTKKLFVLTCNNKHKIDPHMQNRPGRIYYALSYPGLDTTFIEQYCEDNLKNKDYIPKVKNLPFIFEKMNFDMLKAIVEEMNRYNEDPIACLKYLNMKPDSVQKVYNVTILLNGREVQPEDKRILISPLNGDFYCGYFEDENKEKLKELTVSKDSMVSFNATIGEYKYKVDDLDIILRLQKSNDVFEYAYSMI